MTTKDLREIAAYVGCMFTYEELWPNKDSSGEEWRLRKSSGYTLLSALIMIMIGGDRAIPAGVRNIKLHLRSIASMTDDEFREFFALAFPGNECQEIERCGNGYYNLTAGSIWLQVECGPNYAGFSMEAIIDGGQSGRIEAGSAIAYLQSIGIYVPGTIDPQYVEPQP